MLRFAASTDEEKAEVDGDIAASALAKTLEILRTVSSMGGTALFVGPQGPLWLLRAHLGSPVLEPNSIVPDLLLSLPPSEERLTRLAAWAPAMGIDAAREIQATERDLKRGRKHKRPAHPEVVEQPDIVVSLEDPSRILVAEAKTTGIPLVGVVDPENDPSDLFWILPGVTLGKDLLYDFSEAAFQFISEGRREFGIGLREYGEVEFPDLEDLEGDKDLGALLKERLAPPRSTVDVEEVLGSWER